MDKTPATRLPFVFMGLMILASTITVMCSSVSDTESGGPEQVPVHRITGVTVKALEREGNDHFYADTLRNLIRFSVHTESEIIGYTNTESAASMNTDQIPGFIDNPTDPSFASLTLNKTVEYKNRAIESGTNLLDDAEISDSFDGSGSDLHFNPRLSPFAIHEIRLLKKAFQIPKDDYEIVFQWGDKDELFKDTVHVHIDPR